ncbi:MAG: 23S rRNA (guanosine(2251)-2'-O)-methyltransferase RlmB, partial [Syntrophobacterales bacterium]|jgi:23S rRNA (guanosine2251-2'-O)-methyltransferase|nr:23S rRNA (guanosine(2251)-2'-O)-methyltransferase RlmB [Syntrophobacterales bacterium]
MMMNTGDPGGGMQVIYGVNPLMESLKGKGDIQTLFLLREKKGEWIRQFLRLAAEKGIPVIYKTREEMDRLAGKVVHQGVVGIRKAFSYASLEDIVLRPTMAKDKRLIVLLDGVTDPQNMGAIIRTGHCFDVDGFIVPENRSASLTAAVLKASAGALLHMPVAMVVNLARAIDFLKEQKFWIYGADMGGQSDFRVFDRTDRVALVLGSEGNGLRPLIRKKCDFLVSIAMESSFNSLNVSVAAGIIIHNIVNNWKEE